MNTGESVWIRILGGALLVALVVATGGRSFATAGGGLAAWADCCCPEKEHDRGDALVISETCCCEPVSPFRAMVESPQPATADSDQHVPVLRAWAAPRLHAPELVSRAPAGPGPPGSGAPAYIRHQALLR